MRRAAPASAVGLIAVVALLLWPATAGAHALLIRADPPPGASLRRPPAAVTAWFSEPLEPGISSLRVVDGDGGRVDLGHAAFDARDPVRASVALRDGLGPGFYSVTWETLSRVDGHIWFGSFEFTILEPDGSAPAGPHPVAAPAQVDTPPRIAARALAKLAGLAGAAMLVGSLAFALLVARPSVAVLPEGERAVARAAADRCLLLAAPALALLAAAGALELIVQAHQLGGLGETGAVLGTTWGRRWTARQIVLVALAATVMLEARRRWAGRQGAAAAWPALALGLVYLLLISAASHAAAIRTGAFWAAAADFVHLSVAALWVGGLVCLALVVTGSWRDQSGTSRSLLLTATVQRFSLVAAVSGAVLLITGAANALVHVSTPHALVETAYGRAFVAKLVLVLALLAVAAVNAVVLRPRLARTLRNVEQSERLRLRLGRLVRVEAALGLAVLALTALLVQFPTARSATGAVDGAMAGARERFGYPLVIGNWGTVAGAGIAATGVLLWVVMAIRPAARRSARGALRGTALGLPILGLLVVALAGSTGSVSRRAPRELSPVAQVTRGAESGQFASVPRSTPPARAVRPAVDPNAPFTATIGLRYQAADGRFVLLEATPFQLGENTFRVTVLGGDSQPVAVGGVSIHLSRLDHEGNVDEVAAQPAADGRLWVAGYDLAATGWWVIDVEVDGRPAAGFYLRLDAPSRAPLAFDPPDEPADPAAEARFRQTLTRYEHLHSARWREEVTSGLLKPSSSGTWVLTAGEAEAPDRVRIRVGGPGASQLELARVGGTSCTLTPGRPWQCRRGANERAFDLDFQRPAVAFRFGRREVVDGEMCQVLLFYNPDQRAWYAWWVGDGTGYLRKQAMVSPGHFMVARFSELDVPIGIVLPVEAEGVR